MKLRNYNIIIIYTTSLVATTKMAIHATTLNYTLFSDASITPHQGATTFTTQDSKLCFFAKNLRSKEQNGGTGGHGYAQGQVGVAGRTPPAADFGTHLGHRKVLMDMFFWCPRTLHHKFMSYVQKDLRWRFDFFQI